MTKKSIQWSFSWVFRVAFFIVLDFDGIYTLKQEIVLKFNHGLSSRGALNNGAYFLLQIVAAWVWVLIVTDQVPVFQRLDNAIHWMSHCPQALDKC